ncbi:hypothetical protein [Flavihumibacter sp. CACIAM 22H1]|uniref:hypothetical protein n=1 Tax=Flavihumibacter sp. CACIAM 22H1 TaxID=1812911 RepID=UPI0007A83373|nr:hypothetical protein [Flavihumibacter sp. CACIAM 22H1]KYP16625.1 MAG: hypothetical protein A1D16_09440 [Flavihumibacter sp. CACIAM 22H1]
MAKTNKIQNTDNSIQEQIDRLESIIIHSELIIKEARESIKKLQDVRPGVSTPSNFHASASAALMKRERFIQRSIQKKHQKK